MTELIVALDGPEPTQTWAYIDCLPVWRKLGPQAMLTPMWQWIVHQAKNGEKIFLDLKLADTAETCYEAARRFAECNIAAVSTFTDRATEAAMRAAEGTPMRVWQTLALTDERGSSLRCRVTQAHGAIIPGSMVDDLRSDGWGRDIICPGVRIAGHAADGHHHVVTPRFCRNQGVTHVIVGRPIWSASSPREAARWYLRALQ